MIKHKVITFILLISVFTPSAAYCQERIKNQQISTIAGAVTKVDVAGRVIGIQTDTGEMEFYIPEQVKIVRNTHYIALLEIKIGHPVTIQYDNSSIGRNNIISLVDNKPDK